jgi:hypothetical protein
LALDLFSTVRILFQMCCLMILRRELDCHLFFLLQNLIEEKQECVFLR